MTRAEDGIQAGAGLRPFRLVKYFSFTSLGVILVFSLVLAFVVSGNARNVLFERAEANARQLAALLNQQVYLRFVLPTVITEGRIRLREPRQFRRLDTIVRSVIRGMHVDSVTIYDSASNVISYSTDPELVGKRDRGGIEYKRSLEGESSSLLITNGSLLNLLPGSREVYCKVKTYIPFRRENGPDQNGRVMGVFEIVQDLSEDMEAIIRLEARIIAISMLIMGILFAVLRHIVVRAERIIEARAGERRRLERKLAEAERLAGLGKMVAAVSHEIKNPLGIVRSTAEILGKRIGKVAPGNEHLARIIVDETSRLDGIVREFLDFARPRKPALAPAQANDLVGKLVDFVRPECQRAAIRLETRLDPDLPLVDMDAGQIHQALLNIMLNAIQALEGREDGRLELATRSRLPGPGIEIVVRDNGPGMDQQKKDQIFTPFYTDKHRGTGLGLAITRSIVEAHQGEIRVESAPGRGAAFTIVLGME